MDATTHNARYHLLVYAQEQSMLYVVYTLHGGFAACRFDSMDKGDYDGQTVYNLYTKCELAWIKSTHRCNHIYTHVWSAHTLRM